MRTSRREAAWRPAAGSCDELLLDEPRRFGSRRRLIGRRDLRVDLAGEIPVVADCRADPAGVDGEHLRCGFDRAGSALIDLAQELDDLPDVGPERQRGPSAGRTVLEDHPRVVRHPQALVNEPLGQPGGTCSWYGIGALPQPGQQRWGEADGQRSSHNYIVSVALHSLAPVCPSRTDSPAAWR